MKSHRQVGMQIVVLLISGLPLACAHLARASDCNGNGIDDSLDISDGTSPDCNDNAVPDECDVRNDSDGDGGVTIADFAGFQSCFTSECPGPPCDPPVYSDSCCSVFEVDGDGDVDPADYFGFHNGLTGQAPYALHGLDFGPYVDLQDPNHGVHVSEEQLVARMRIIASYTQWIRTFGCGGGLEATGRIAHELGLHAAVGAWLGPNPTANQQEVSNLIAAAQAGEVDLAIVGSEVLLRHDLTEAQLIGYINQVRAAIPAHIPVTTGDTYDVYLTHPSLVQAVDVLFINYYPYWEGVDLDWAVASIHCRHRQLAEIAAGKPIIVSETGWPSCGETIGDAVPSAENASFYFLNLVSWARANEIGYFYFEGLDESWKANYEGPQGACWGVWDKNGYLKPGMDAVFRGAAAADNWSAPGGPGDPHIEFVYVPPYGSFENLVGVVRHVSPLDHWVAIYIYVNGGWWTKPYWNRPLTAITCTGSWVCDITTGGVDQQATRIAAFLLPSGYDPPLMSGGSSLPGTLEENALDSVEIERSP